MSQAGVKELKTHLSEYLQRVREGERIVITDRGRPIAQLAPVEESPEAVLVWGLVRDGKVRWNGGKPQGCPNAPRPRRMSAAAAVIEDRR